MNFNDAIPQTIEFFKFVATSSTFGVSFWIAVIAIVLLIFRRAGVRFLWRNLHLIEDLVLQREFFAQADWALRLLFTMLALLPFLHFLPDPSDRIATKIDEVLILFSTLYIVVKAVDLIVFGWYFAKHREANVPSVLRFVALGSIYASFGLLFLEWLGVNLLPLLATSTILTAVLGLSMQDTLKNLFAGITLSFEKRFRQGDWIAFRIDPNNVTIGQVIELGWRTTKLKTLENAFSVIPNSMFATNHMVNFSSHKDSYMRTVEIPVQTHAHTESLLPLLYAAAVRAAGVLLEPAPEVIVSAVKVDHLLVRIRFNVADFAQSDLITSTVLNECLKELDKLHLFAGEPACEAVAESSSQSALAQQPADPDRKRK